MFTMKKITLATTLALLMTTQAQAAKLIPATTPAANNPPTAVITAAPIATLAQATPIPATTPTPRPTTAPAAASAATATAISTGFYMGAQLGDSSIGAVMGYQFTKLFGMEISYDYFDPLYTRAVTTTTAEKNRLGASALAMFPMKFSEMGPMALYVKVGYARTTDKLITDDPGLGAIPPSTFVTTTTKTGVTGGAGIHVDMSKSSTVRLGVNVVGAERATYLAALYRF